MLNVDPPVLEGSFGEVQRWGQPQDGVASPQRFTMELS